MKRHCLTAICCAFLLWTAHTMYAQVKVDGVGLRLGVAAGAPIAKPDSGATGWPGAGMVRGVAVDIRLAEHWGLEVGTQFARLRGSFYSPIAGDTTVIQEILPGQFIPIETFYKGDVEGNFDNAYWQFPILATYRGKALRLVGGGYLGILARGSNTGLVDVVIGDSFRIDLNVPYDQSEQMYPLDYGAVLGGGYRLPMGLDFSARAYIGLRSIYQKSFREIDGPVQNIYLQCTLGWFWTGQERPPKTKHIHVKEEN